MKNLYCNCKSLNFNELLKVNGGYSSSSGGGGSRTSYSSGNNSRSSATRSYSSSYSSSSGGSAISFSSKGANILASASNIAGKIIGTGVNSLSSALGKTIFSGVATGIASGLAGLTSSMRGGTSSSSYSTTSARGTTADPNVARISDVDSRLRTVFGAKKRAKYKLTEFDCDIYVEECLNDAGFTDFTSMWGKANQTNCDQHVQILGDKLTSKPDAGWAVVLMTEGHKVKKDDGTEKILMSHAAVVEVSKINGAVKVYQNSSAVEQISYYPSIKAFQADYGYDKFSYYQLTNTTNTTIAPF